MTNPANERSVLDVPCTHVAPNTERCGALVGNPCMGPDLLPCPAHPERIAAARLHYGIADLPELPMPFAVSQRAEVLATLHANIQDVFNEYGVQIMSPHYMADTAEPQVVPPGPWSPPAGRPPDGWPASSSTAS